MNWIELNVREQSLDFSCSVIGVDMRGISVTFWPFVFLSACFRSPWLHISVFWRKLQYVQENHRSVVKACNAFHNYTVKVFVCFLLVCIFYWVHWKVIVSNVWWLFPLWPSGFSRICIKHSWKKVIFHHSFSAKIWKITVKSEKPKDFSGYKKVRLL